MIERDPARAQVHARLAALTGPAPAEAVGRPAELVERALSHPYDPSALLAGGEELVRRGDLESAIRYFERAVWLADIDPPAAREALSHLGTLSEPWSRRRVVPVEVYAGERIRSEPGWRFRIRTLWLAASESLDPVIETRFVPVHIGALDLADEPGGLDGVHAALLARTTPPYEGIRAAFTQRPIRDRGPFKRGVAEFCGRSLVVRLEPGATRSRVLAHEILHLYGAIHVLDGVDSLMNPSGTSLTLDGPSARIVRATRDRTFGAGGAAENVLPRIDLGEAIAAYRSALSVNLGLREAGVAQLLGARRSTAHDAARGRHVQRLDSHLADVARWLSVLMLSDARREEALELLELASQLYGTDVRRGRETLEQVELLRASIAGNAALPAP